MSDITILGAGLAGLSCAYHLKQDYEIYEKEPQIGGVCKSKKVNGFIFDYDGHLLHFKNNHTRKLIDELLGDRLIRHKRRALVYSHDTYTEYPFQAKLYGLPTPVIEECLAGLIKANCSSSVNTNNFKQWILSKFGEGIAKHFMLPYNEKFWTIPLEELTTEWVDRFIPVPTLKQILHGSLQTSKEEFGYNINFWYPAQGGISRIPEAFSEKIEHIYAPYKVTKINLASKEIEFEEGQVNQAKRGKRNRKKLRYNNIVSTVPLPELANVLVPLSPEIEQAFKRLKFTSIYVLNLGIKRKRNSHIHWIYFPSKQFPFYRIGFPHNFSVNLVPKNCSSMYVEVAYSPYYTLDKKNIDEEVIERLIQLDIIHSKTEIITIYPMDIKYGYVIYDKNYNKSRNTIIEFLKNNNVYCIGRYGSWEYKSMEDVILDGKETAERLNSN